MDENLPNKLDHLFNNALQKYASEPSAGVWQKIEEELDKEGKKIVWYALQWKYLVTAAVLIIGSLGVLYNIFFHQENIVKQRKNLPAQAVTITAQSSDEIPVASRKSGYSRGIIAFKGSSIIHAKSKTGDPINMDMNQDGVSGDLSLVSTQPVLSRLQAAHIIGNELPVSEVNGSILTPVIRKMPFKDRLSITPYFSQEFAGATLTDNDLTGISGQEIEERERNVFSASVGIYVNYRLTKKWFLQSGISYSWSNSNIDSATSYAVKDDQGNVRFKLNTISGYGYLHTDSSPQPSVGDSVSTGKSFSQLHYLTLPLILNYRVAWGKLSLLIGAGGSFNVLTGAEIETKTFGNGRPEKEYSVNMMGLKKVNYGLIVKLDLEYPVNSHLGINLIPCFKNTLSPINLESALSAYPYNFGIGAGATYHF